MDLFDLQIRRNVCDNYRKGKRYASTLIFSFAKRLQLHD